MKIFSFHPLFASFALLAATAFAAEPLPLTVPPVVYGVPGVPVSIYYDNIVLTQTPEQDQFSVKCNIGSSEAKRWTVTPTDKDVGDHPMEITVKDPQHKTQATARTTLRIAPKNAGAGRELRLLIVGDSLTHASYYPNEIARLLSEPGNPKWTLLGTHKPPGVKPGVAHEGYGGWRWETFLTKFTVKPPETAAGPLAPKITSPFIYADASGKGVFDLPRYFRESCNNQPPDVVTFLLGINDCFSANADDAASVEKVINAALDHADKLLAEFHKAAPKAALAVGLVTPPNSREEAFEANYHGKYHRWGWKRIQYRLVQRMLERLSHREKENIYLVPTELNLDPVDGYSNNNGVHPNPTGYAQIGVSFYAWLKNWMK